ncbi:MAG: hypothetical protein JO165_11790 [Candidatus Eremiobacteraeota bacterium]|nr:hypothetical protein [Candidatus Eremiobacteraeota bacterium]
MIRPRLRFPLAALASAALLNTAAGAFVPSNSAAAQTLLGGGKILHVIIIFQENRTPDNLFHGLPGADIANSGLNSHGAVVPLQPISITARYDLDHSHAGFRTEYNAGKMNGFNLEHASCPSHTCPTTTAYGYVPPSQVSPYFQMAEQYVFGDRMFQTNQGPSFPAHQFIISGTSTNAPGSTLLAAENPFYAAGDMQNCLGSPSSRVRMIDPAGSENTLLPPCFNHQTLTDRLDAKGVSWHYYAPSIGGLWNGPDAISHIRSGPDWAKVIIPQTQVLNDITNRQLRSVSWVIPSGRASDHALGTDGSGPAWVASIVNAVGTSPYWNSTAILITWDDWGGWYDHVAPVQYNSYELGFRVPLVVVSPYAKAHYVSHVQHEFGSLLHFTEAVFGTGTVGYTDARADNLADCFNFAQSPRPFHQISATMSARDFLERQDSTPPDND